MSKKNENEGKTEVSNCELCKWSKVSTSKKFFIFPNYGEINATCKAQGYARLCDVYGTLNCNLLYSKKGE